MSDIKDVLINDLSNFWRLWRKITYAPVKRGEISLEQYWILQHLMRHGPITVRELSDFLGTTPSSITIITKKMEKSNLLERVRGDPDDRTVTMSIIEEGRKRWNEWQEKRKEALSHILSSLTAEEQEKLHILILKILSQTYTREK
jgi:DNA-binding MarR family transcriptional regulator